MAQEVEPDGRCPRPWPKASVAFGFPNLLHWAETNRNLPEVLHMAGSMFESRARSHSTFAGTVVSVLCVFSSRDGDGHPGLFLPLITYQPFVRMIQISTGGRYGH